MTQENMGMKGADMESTGIPELDRTLNRLDTWLHAVMAEMGTDKREEAYAALHATMRALRDRLPVDEAAHLAAQLPVVIRGLYFDGWDPTRTPLKERHLKQFLGHIRDSLDNRINLEPDVVARAVFAVLAGRVSAGEIDDVVGCLPAELKDLWPAAAR